MRRPGRRPVVGEAVVEAAIPERGCEQRVRREHDLPGLAGQPAELVEPAVGRGLAGRLRGAHLVHTPVDAFAVVPMAGRTRPATATGASAYPTDGSLSASA